MTDYLTYSFRSNFKLNQRDLEPFECPKLLGDLFESVIGAIFIDSPHGLDDVIRVFKHFLSPFVLFVAKFSKVLYKEHKEEFLWTAVAKKIRPQFRFSDEPIPVVVGDTSYQVEAMMYRADVIYN